MSVKSVPKRSIGKLLSMLILLSLVFVGLAPQAALGSDPDGPEMIPGQMVYLRAGDEDAFTFVPPPADFSRESSAQSVTINVTYNGFTPEAQNAFQHAVDIWASQLTSGVPIEVVANWEALEPNVLGAAGPANFLRNFPNAPRADTWYPIAIANKLAGQDLAPPPGDDQSPAHDIRATFSSEFNWYFGTDGQPAAGQSDFVSVVLHELGHGLGFSGSAMVENGQGSWGLGSGFPFVYDVFVQNGQGQSIIDTNLFPNPSAGLAAQLQGANQFFNSPTVLAINNGNPPQLYAPAVWEQGSSYSHLDETVYPAGNPNSLMTPTLNTAEAMHDPGPITRAMFTDMGWTTDPPTAVTISNYDATSDSMPFAMLGGVALLTLGLAALLRKRGRLS